MIQIEILLTLKEISIETLMKLFLFFKLIHQCMFWSYQPEAVGILRFYLTITHHNPDAYSIQNVKSNPLFEGKLLLNQVLSQSLRLKISY